MKPVASNLILWLLLAGAVDARILAADETNAPVLADARDFYNEGTKLLAAKKLADAERMFESSLAEQDERLQPVTMYNLGHVRFADGLDILKKGPDAQKVAARGQAALAAADGAIQAGEGALVDNQLEEMVEAYIQGRGVQHELRAAEKAVKAALDVYGKTLSRWRRADDDFKGAAELNPADTNATHNATVVEQDIAKLVDTMQKMQEMLGQMAGRKQQLGQTLSKLKGQIPAPNAPPGGKGDGDEEDNGSGQGDVNPESLAGKEEKAGGDGNEIQVPLSRDQAAQMLDGLPVDGSRRLPLGGDQQGQPSSDRHGRIW
jgi:tetratricopeptide (TPR) repeat protein